ncbi:MAG: RIP metalloprotease RseP [Verrucomicrobiaceae bacterium]|nr:RIP metalloprotease RseP [Verrucomicrobiaceae bacterium]
MDWLSSLGPVGSFLRWVIICIEVIIVFNLMILVHEWGHFLAARWRGLYVDRFQIWFGKPIWKKTVNGVQYGLGCIPAGGFVSLPQMAPMESIEGTVQTEEPLPPISAMDKIIVAFAGPLFSFMLAAFFALMVHFVGKPQSMGHTTTTIGYVAKESPAAKAGLKAGDKILSIDGNPILRFSGMVDSVQWAVVAGESELLQVEVDRPGTGKLTLPVDPTAWDLPAAKEEAKDSPWWRKPVDFLFKRPPLKDIGIMGAQSPMVGSIQENSPAADAGLKPNDLITKLDGIELLSGIQIGDYMQANPDKPSFVLTVKRGKEELEIPITPRVPDTLAIAAAKAKEEKAAAPAATAATTAEAKSGDEEAPSRKMGIVWDLQGERGTAYPGVGEQLIEALKTMRNTLGAVFSSKSDIGLSHLSGPAGIFRVYYNLFERADGWQLVLWFSVILNVNLAVLNMLPFPVLDGGHITMALAEMVRGKPAQSRLLEYVQAGCALMLFGFMIWVTLKDLGDVGGGGGSGKVPNNWLPKAERLATP